MTNHDIAHLRLQSQAIGIQTTTPHNIGLHMAALQAQDYYGSLWTIGTRTGLTQAKVVAALENLELIRTWPQRGTLHFVLPEDALWMTSLSAERLIRGATTRRVSLGLDDKTLAYAKKIFAENLAGTRLTRPELMNLLEMNGIAVNGGRGYHILWYAAQTAQLYIGPMQSKQQTFGLLTDLPIVQRKLSREASIIELARRYFTSHGPATLQDFMWWSGLTSKDARVGLEANATELTILEHDGITYWMARQTTTLTMPNALLLPGFDEYILGYKNRDAQLPADFAERLVPGGNGMFMPSIVVDGQVVGVWSRTLKKDHVQITVALLRKLAQHELNAVQMAIMRYGEFMELTPEVSGL